MWRTRCPRHSHIPGILGALPLYLGQLADENEWAICYNVSEALEEGGDVVRSLTLALQLRVRCVRTVEEAS